MGEVVNRTWEIAAAWQREVVWMRMNVAYIAAELPHLVAEQHDVADIEPLMAAFDSAFAAFCADEHHVFILARRTEVDGACRSKLVARLQHLRDSFRRWAEAYHEVVQKRRTAAHDGLSLSLLMGCGAELHRSHGAFRNVVDGYIEELRQAGS
jgi:hypothetical protein